MTIPEDSRYAKSHEYIHVENGVGTVGITDYAQNSLGDIVFVELPKVGTVFGQGDNVGVIESVKAVSDLFTPVSGRVSEVNTALDADSSILNREPYTGGWLFKVKDVGEEQLESLLDAADYAKLTAE